MLTILGGGAIGLFLASLLSNNDVILITHSIKQSKKINSDGIYVSGLKKFHTKNVKSLSFYNSKLSKFLPYSKVFFICLKSYDTKNVLLRLKKNVSENTIIVTIQNGLGNKEIIKQIFPNNRVLESVISFGVTKISENRVSFCGRGDMIISDYFKKEKFLENDFEIKIRYVKNITLYLWEKFMINCAINAVGTILNIRNGELLNRNYIKNIMEQLIEEMFSVAKSYNIKITKNIFKKTEKICLKTAKNVNSMLQDILKHKSITEIEFLNGKLLSMAKTKGLYLPANETVYELIKTIEQTNKEIYG